MAQTWKTLPLEGSSIIYNDPWKTWLSQNNLLLDKYGVFSTKYYSHNFDEIINNGIRNHRLSETGYIVLKRIINVISKAGKNPTDIYIYRGIKENSFLNKNTLKSGAVIQEPGFTSQSLNRNNALNFTATQYAGVTPIWGNCCVLVIKYIANTVPMILLTGYNATKHEEREILTYPGEILQVENSFQVNEDVYNGSGSTKRKAITHYSVNVTGFIYKRLPEDIRPIVDVSIDKAFKIFISNIADILSRVDFISFIIEGQYMVLSLGEQFIFMQSEFNIDFIQSLYKHFVQNNITQIFIINGLKDLISKWKNKIIECEYRKVGGSVIKCNWAEILPFIFRGENISLNIENNLSVVPSNINFRIPTTPEYTSGALDIENRDEEFQKLPDYIQTALYKLYGDLDPVLYYNIIPENIQNSNLKRLDNIIRIIDTTSPYELAQQIGMVIPVSVNAHDYILKNIPYYVNNNDINLITKTGVYYPEWLMPSSYGDILLNPERLLLTETSNKVFLPYICMGKQNLIIENGTIRLIDNPMIAYGTLSNYTCNHIDVLVNDLINRLNVIKSRYNRNVMINDKEYNDIKSLLYEIRVIISYFGFTVNI